MGCDVPLPYLHYNYRFQSTHPCGVRLCGLSSNSLPWGFQSTHPCGVRHLIHPHWFRKGGFNPRTRVGCDGRTIPRYLVIRGFNPRTRVGCDDSSISIRSVTEFQSTHPCGVRLLVRRLLAQFLSFNPRTRVGCDYPHEQTQIIRAVSIHAPVWGATVSRGVSNLF